MAAWLVLLALTAVAVAVVVRPMLRARVPGAARHAREMEVYRAQLAEIARRRADGTISAEEADDAEAETGRRLLALAENAPAAETAHGARGSGRWGALVLGLWVGLGSLAVYLIIGAPGMPDFPNAARQELRARVAPNQLPPAEQEAMIRAMVDGLARRLEAEPDNLDGWMRLGRSYQVLDEVEKSRDAYARAAALAPENKDVLLAYGQAMLAAAPQEAKLTPAFVQLMTRIRALDPGHPVPLFFLGIAEAEAGNMAAAEALWTKLRAAMPEGTPERADIESRIAAVKKRATPN
jgi:cytochrome c-type biogenesis protein CcmH